MVYAVVKNVQLALKQRGGWKGLLQHMYTNGDYPFKAGTYIGADPSGNKYYENRVDYPYGQHRWVEPSDTHNFDSTSIPPEWHGWMTSMNDVPPSEEENFIQERTSSIQPLCQSDAPFQDNMGYQNKVFNFHHLHNQTGVRSRGYGIGNPIVGLPPHVKDAYYTQPGSPYNESSIAKKEVMGTLDKDGGRAYKNVKWAERLKTEEERTIEAKQGDVEMAKLADEDTGVMAQLLKMQKDMLKSRGAGSLS